MKYWIVVAYRTSYLKHGINHDTYIFGVFQSEEEAEAFTKSDKAKDMISELKEKTIWDNDLDDDDDSLSITCRIIEFNSLMTTESCPLHISGAYYNHQDDI